MIGSLSAYSPGSIPSFGSADVSSPAVFRDENGEVCSSFECKTHGALLKAQLQASFPGLTVLGVEPGEEQQSVVQPATARPVAAAPGAGLASGQTLLTAQEQGGSSQAEPKAPGQLTEEEKQQVAKLKQTDAKVRAHERAHAAVGGQYAGAPSYSYTRGPDGQLYAVSGEVAIDIGAESDPEATLQKASQVAAAALAPADPSGADRAVAAAAAQLRLQALAQIREEKRAEQEAAAEADRQAPETLPGQRPPAGEASPATTQSDPATPAARAAGAYARTAGQASNDNGAAFSRIGSLVGLTA